MNHDRLDKAKQKLTKILKSEEGKEALRLVTGLEIVWNSDAQKERERLPIVMVLSPSYKARVGQSWNAVEKMIVSARAVCRPVVEPRYSSSVVHWSRNSGLADLLKGGKEFDYVLFVDDDISPPEDALVKMLAHKKDFVGGACTVRTDPPVPNFRVYTPDNHTFHTCFSWQKDSLIGGMNYGVGAGLILISFSAVCRVAEYYVNCEYEKKYYGLSGERLDQLQNQRQADADKTFDYWWFEFLKHPEGRGEFGEDISFCFKLLELGIPVYIDTSVKPKHVGDYGYSLDDFEGSYQRSVMEDMLQQEIHDTGLLGLPGEDPEPHGGVEISPSFADPLLGASMQENECH